MGRRALDLQSGAIIGAAGSGRLRPGNLVQKVDDPVQHRITPLVAVAARSLSMMVATLADTATEFLLTVEHDLVGVVLVDEEHEQVTPLLRVTTELSVEFQQVIVSLAAAGVHRAQRVLSAYVAARCILEDLPPKAKMKSMARVLSHLLRFEEVAAREPDLDRILAQARVTARGVKARKLTIDWSLSKLIAR